MTHTVPSSNQSLIAQRSSVRAANKAGLCIYPLLFILSKCLLSSFRSTPDIVVYSSCAAACKALYSASRSRTDTVICFSCVVIVNRPFFFVHRYVKRGRILFSSLVLTVFQNFLTTSQELRPHKTGKPISKIGLPEIHPLRPRHSDSSSHTPRTFLRRAFCAAFQSVSKTILCDTPKNRAYLRITKLKILFCDVS